jgi:hypothetical protein
MVDGDRVSPLSANVLKESPVAIIRKQSQYPPARNLVKEMHHVRIMYAYIPLLIQKRYIGTWKCTCATLVHTKKQMHCTVAPIRWLWQRGHQEQEGGTEKVPHAARTYAVSSVRFHPYLRKLEQICTYDTHVFLKIMSNRYPTKPLPLELWHRAARLTPWLRHAVFLRRRRWQPSPRGVRHVQSHCQPISATLTCRSLSTAGRRARASLRRTPTASWIFELV